MILLLDHAVLMNPLLILCRCECWERAHFVFYRSARTHQCYTLHHSAALASHCHHTAITQPETAQRCACRWLEPGAAKALSQHQLPFGTGQRTCLGMNLANAEMVAVLAELGRSYTLTADVDTDWLDFPIKKPVNGLPIRLVQRQPGANGGAAAAAPAALAGPAAV